MSIRFRLEEKSLYRMLNAVFLVCLGLFGAGGYFGIPSPGALHVSIALAALLILTVFHDLSAKGRILWGLGVTGCLLATAAVAGFEACVRFLTSYAHWLFAAPPWQEEWIRGYEGMQTLFVALVCYLLQMILDRDFRIKMTGALLLTAGLVYCFFAERELSHAGMALAVCYLAMILMEWIRRHWKKEKSRSVQAYMLWMTPFLMIYLVALLCIPMPRKPYDWQLFKDVYRQLSESFRTLSLNMLSFGREDLDSSLSGFSGRGTLGSGFWESEREVMTVQCAGGLRTNAYLIGKVYDTFDGTQWQQLNEDTSRERYIDTVKTLYAVRRYDSEYQRDYVYRTDLEIRYEYFNSRYLFAPLKTWGLKQQNRDMHFEESGGSLLFDKKKGYGTEYTAVYYQLNMGQEAFDEFLEAEPEPDEGLLREILIYLRSHSDVELTPADLEAHEQMVYDFYLGEVSLSEEVEEYLARITQNAKTDVEKLRAIEAELSAFTYNRMPGELPDKVMDDRTFLDYFLLESRQGYCSHFATAFVLLARAEGIPARYAQGYYVPMEARKEVVVTSDMAHAWPEVYLEDIGWIPFEPTPGYGAIRYTPWEPERRETLDSTGNGQGEGEGVSDETEDVADELPEELTEEELPEEEAKEGNIGKILRIFLLSMGSVIVVGVPALFLDRLVGRYRYRKMDEQQKYMAEIRINFKILSWLEIDRQEGETLEELKKRMSACLNPEELRFVEAYEEFLYGSRPADSGMLRLAKEEQSRLVQMLKQKKRWVYLYYCVFINPYGENVNMSKSKASKR